MVVLLRLPLATFLLNPPLNLFLIQMVVLLRVPLLNLSVEASFQQWWFCLESRFEPFF